MFTTEGDQHFWESQPGEFFHKHGLRSLDQKSSSEKAKPAEEEERMREAGCSRRYWRMLGDSNLDSGLFADVQVGPDSVVIRRKGVALRMLAPTCFLIVWALSFFMIGGFIGREGSTVIRVLLMVMAGAFVLTFVGVILVGLSEARTVITLDAEGVCMKGLLFKKRLTWPEVRYWGLVLVNSERRLTDNKHYFLYFTKKHPPRTVWANGFGLKIVFMINKENRPVFMEQVIPFCASHADSGPDLREIEEWWRLGN